MNANVSKLLNEQINKEFYSAYLYLDFANYYASVGLDGFENWYRVQAQEERDHAMLFYQYLQNNGEGVTFEAITKPEWERGDHMTPLKKALEHEKLVTASIDAIYALCMAAWGDGYYGYQNTLMVHIRRLREKLEENPSQPKHLLTVKGLGYKLVISDE